MFPKDELLPETWLYELSGHEDKRGSFVKTYLRSEMDKYGVYFDFSEEFYSSSRRDVIRGMHFQRPPHDHMKLVYCPVGEVLDVVLDLRPGSGYGRFASVKLSEHQPMFLLIPRGVAHGFRALTDGAIMVYKTSTEHVPTHDCGVRWDSFGFDWQCASPLLSDRDLCHPSLTDLSSSF